MTVNVTPDNDPPTVQTGVDTPDDDSDDTSSVGEVTTLEVFDHRFFYDDGDLRTSITITDPSTGMIWIDGVELRHSDNSGRRRQIITYTADIDATYLITVSSTSTTTVPDDPG